MGDEAMRAAREGDSGRLCDLLDAHPELVGVRGSHEVTLLHVAAERNDVPMLELLLERGADLEAEADWGYTAFEWAAAMAADEAARLLLARGAERLNLWTAAALGMSEEVQACFEDGRLMPGSGRRPRPGADLTGWPEEAPYRTGDELSDAFHIAARNGRREVAEYLLARGADVDAIGYFGATGLQWAAVAGREEIVRWLLEVGADPGKLDRRFGSPASGWAREGGHHDLATFLRTRE